MTNETNLELNEDFATTEDLTENAETQSAAEDAFLNDFEAGFFEDEIKTEKTDTQTDTETDTQTDTETDTETDTDTDTDTEKPENKIETGAESETRTKAEAKKDDKEKEPQTVKAVYNGKEFLLDKEAAKKAAQGLGLNENQLITVIQKGLNYDNLKTSFASSPESKALDILAENADMSRKDYINAVLKDGENMLQKKEEDILREKYPYADDEDIAQMAQNIVSQKKSLRIEKAKKEAEAAKQEGAKVWVDFFKKFPHIKPDDLPPDMYERVKNGENPITVQLEIEKNNLEKENREIKRKLDAAWKNNANKAKAIGSIRSDGKEDTDDFLSGFLS